MKRKMKRMGTKPTTLGVSKVMIMEDEQESDMEYDRKTKSKMTRNMIGKRTKVCSLLVTPTHLWFPA